MSSHRPYRPSLGMGRALEEILQGRGIRFDEKVVDACLTLCRSGQFSFDGPGGPPGMRAVEAVFRYPNGEGST